MQINHRFILMLLAIALIGCGGGTINNGNSSDGGKSTDDDFVDLGPAPALPVNFTLTSNPSMFLDRATNRWTVVMPFTLDAVFTWRVPQIIPNINDFYDAYNLYLWEGDGPIDAPGTLVRELFKDNPAGFEVYQDGVNDQGQTIWVSTINFFTAGFGDESYTLLTTFDNPLPGGVSDAFELVVRFD